MSKEFYRGEIFYIRNESEYSGNVQGGGRPAVIISNDIGNNAGPILEVVYLTTQEKKPLPTHVKINSSKYPSTVLCEQIDTVNKDKVGDYMSTFERMLRYAKYGYFPCKETKMKIINALRDLTDEQVELSENLYDGMD